MNLFCRIKGHKWDGCRCRRCEEIRNEGHDFRYYKGLVCVKCGGIRRSEADKCICCGKPLNGNRAMDVPVAVCVECRSAARPNHTHLVLHLREDNIRPYETDNYYVCLNCGMETVLCSEGKSSYSDYEKKKCVMEEVRSSRFIRSTYFIGE